MNYLAHFALNQRDELPITPYFALGVALPDLWNRYSRRLRIQWRAVRACAPRDAVERELREGLLNHADVDRQFHALPLFVTWQRDVKAAVRADAAAADVHPAVIDFLAHVAIELALDHHLVSGDAEMVEAFYGELRACDHETVEAAMLPVGGVAAPGLGAAISGFIERAYLHHYVRADGLCGALHGLFAVLRMTPPPERVLALVVAEAIARARPAAVWEALAALRAETQPQPAGGSV